MGLKVLESSNDVGDLVGPQELEQRLDPFARLRSVGAMDLIGDGPEVGVGVIEVQSLGRFGETVFYQIQTSVKARFLGENYRRLFSVKTGLKSLLFSQGDLQFGTFG